MTEGNVDVGSGAQQGTIGYNTPPTISSALSATIAYSNIKYQSRQPPDTKILSWYPFDESDGSKRLTIRAVKEMRPLKICPLPTA